MTSTAPLTSIFVFIGCQYPPLVQPAMLVSQMSDTDFPFHHMERKEAESGGRRVPKHSQMSDPQQSRAAPRPANMRSPGIRQNNLKTKHIGNNFYQLYDLEVTLDNIDCCL